MVIAAAVNLPLLKKSIGEHGELAVVKKWLDNNKWVNRYEVLTIGNGIAGALVLLSIIRLLASANPKRQLAITLRRRGDFGGAAVLYEELGEDPRALEFLKKARDWSQAARVAKKIGRNSEAAALLRQVGGRSLIEAADLYRHLGENEAAKKCEHGLAQWHLGADRFDEAIVAWMRAGKARWAARAANRALDKRRLATTSPAFAAARKAAEGSRDHRLLARLNEAGGNWSAAARAWRQSGQMGKAAENHRRAGELDLAAKAAHDAGQPKESVRLGIQHLEQLRERLIGCEARGEAATEKAKLSEQIRNRATALVGQLEKLGMDQEVIRMLRFSGRIEEAVEKLVAAGLRGAAAELAREEGRRELAAPLLEQLGRWMDASEVHEEAGDLLKAARLAERGGAYERALGFYGRLEMVVDGARCLARLGRLEDGLIKLHRDNKLEDACRLLLSTAGLVGKIPAVIIDIAEWAWQKDSKKEAIACMQRAVLGLPVTQERLKPAVILAGYLYRAGDPKTAQDHLQRILNFDYSFEPAQRLKQRIDAELDLETAKTQPFGESSEAEERHEVGGQAEERYEILSELGRGGMGVVHKARDTRLEREVAIKILRTTDRKDADLLEREARAVATLNHPGIVTVYDFAAGFGGYFIVMECVPGKSLGAVLREELQRLTTNLLSILIQLTESVAYAHERKVIHRDLKPGNVLLTPNNETKILDFGLAARLDTDSPHHTLAGTPYYMAPEQIRGEAPTPATDIYSFGAMAYHLATRRPPFKGANLLNAHLGEQAPDPRTIVSSLNPLLAQTILRCLEKAPGDRYASATDLGNALRTAKSNQA